MDWYRAFGKRLFFLLPPEEAHWFANKLMALPLPWEQVGSVASAKDPVLKTQIAGMELRNPIGLAAGFAKNCKNLPTLARMGFGYVVGGTITRQPRVGNPKPRIVRYPAKNSMVNALGLPNIGAEAAAIELAAAPTPVPRWVSIADEAIDDALVTLDLVAPEADAIELNASCPNVQWGRDRDNEAHLRQLVGEMTKRTPKPIFVKLPPFSDSTERDVVVSLASVAQEAGAAGLTCSNTRLVGDTHLSTGRGGLSGAALRAWTPDIVEQVHRETGGEIPINACGGIATGEDAFACLQAGATTVQVYTSFVYRGPAIASMIARELAPYLKERAARPIDPRGDLF